MIIQKNIISSSHFELFCKNWMPRKLLLIPSHVDICILQILHVLNVIMKVVKLGIFLVFVIICISSINQL